MKRDTFECPPQCTKPPQWPFGHVAVGVVRGRGRADAGSVEAWAIRNKEVGG
jgi:hypothetical protein